MAQKRKQYVKLANGQLEQQMIATSADIVEIEAIDGITATNVQGALEEIKTIADTGGVTSVNGQTGDVTLDKSSVGLGKVDNTSDAAKPISTATQAALDKKADETDLQTLQGKVTTLIGSDTGKSVRTVAAEETAKIVAGANTSYDTLKEIADWITSDTTGAAAMNSQIQTNKSDIADLETADGQNVKKTGDQTIAGKKTFTTQTGFTDGILFSKRANSTNSNLTFEYEDNGTTYKVTLDPDEQALSNQSFMLPSASGQLALDTPASTSASGLMTPAMVTKLNGVAENATANTGTVTSVTITGGTGISVNSSSAITTSGSRTISLADSGVTPGTYCAVVVDAKGRVTQGTHIVEWGISGQKAPTNLAVGGLFFELVE